MSAVINKCVETPTSHIQEMLFSGAWLSGFAIGFLGGFLGRDCLISLLCEITPAKDSFIQKTTIVLFPFLLSALAVYLNCPKWLFLICGTKAAHFSFRCFLLYLCYGQACWLSCCLFMFTEICSLPCLFFYCIRHISLRRDRCLYTHVLILILVAVFAILDYRVVSPYAARF